jgi:methylmalonyl-CoA/ethylmalonyl-CoA epimerase
MIRRLDHIGIAVRDLEAAMRVYTEGLGLTCDHQETVEDQKVRTAFLPVGETHVELLESLSPDGPIGRYIEKRGEGIHHLCFDVTDIRQALAACEKAGLALIDREPRVGAHNKLVAFVHPKSTHGVLIELSQDREAPGPG